MSEDFFDLPILSELGDALDAASRRQSARQWRPRLLRAGRPLRPLVVALALSLALAASAAAAAYYVLHVSAIAPFPARDVPIEQSVVPGSSHVLALRAAEPGGHAAPWALRIARSRTGLVCGTVGQVDRGQFGVVGLDRRFRALPDVNADACGQSRSGELALLGTRVFDAPHAGDVRTVLSGVAGGQVADVRVAVRGGTPQRVPHTAAGAFLAVFSGYPEDVQPVVLVRWRDGHTRRVALAASPFVVPDPLGVQAWRLESFTSDRAGTRITGHDHGRAIRVPLFTCVRFATARGGPAAAASPPFCGHGGRAIYFGTRRLSGRGDPYDPLAGAWREHAPRTAVWGDVSRDLVREIVITAPGVRRAVHPTINGSFLVVLSPRVRPAAVRVQLRFRDGHVQHAGPSYGLVDPRKAS